MKSELLKISTVSKQNQSDGNSKAVQYSMPVVSIITKPTGILISLRHKALKHKIHSSMVTRG